MSRYNGRPMTGQAPSTNGAGPDARSASFGGAYLNGSLKRGFDLIAAVLASLVLWPLFLIVSLVVLISSGGPILFLQERVGRRGRPFQLLKFRTMRVGSENGLPITADGDHRITRVGRFLRATKLDELPQVINILKGDMSWVGPRPEMGRYVLTYTAEQRRVLEARPGLTDPATLSFLNEEQLLGTVAKEGREQYYVEEVLPRKLSMSLEYVGRPSFSYDLTLIVRTLLAMCRRAVPLRLPADFRSVASRLWSRGTNLALRFLADAVLLTLAFAASFYIRFDGYVPSPMWGLCVLTLPWVIALKLVVYWYAGLFRSLWRYSGVNELQRLLVAQAGGLGASLLVVTMSRAATDGFPRGVFLIDAALSLVLTGGIRFAARWVQESHSTRGVAPESTARRRDARRVLVVGAGDAGEMVVRKISKNPANDMRLVGLVDDDPCKRGREIHGVRVLGTCRDIARLAEEHGVEEIILTLPSASGAEIRAILRDCRGAKARLRIVPSLSETVSGSVQITDIRDLRIEDLLRRKEIDLRLDLCSGYLRDKRILVTGAGGSIGSELCVQIAHFQPRELVLLGRGENSIFSIAQKLSALFPSIRVVQIIGDVINKRKLEGVFKAHPPEIVFHAGADKHVPLMEMNPDEAVLNNILGTRNVLEVCEAHGVERLVCVSTDKVVNPTSVMGCCKRVAEFLVQSRAWKTPSMVVRFGNVLGSRGSVVPTIYEQIRNGGPVTITHPGMTRFFMTIPEAAKLVIQAGALGQGGEIFVLDMGEPVKILDLARDMIQLAGLDPENDVPVQIVGIRPGEKLTEELADGTEELQSTNHPKILRVKGNGDLPVGLDAQLGELFQAALDMNDSRIRALLSRIVSTYRPIELPKNGTGPHVEAIRGKRQPHVPAWAGNGARTAAH